jgi:hypothetical protein
LTLSTAVTAGAAVARRWIVITAAAVAVGALPYVVAVRVYDVSQLTGALANDSMVMWALFVPAIVAFWPMVRFVGPGSLVPVERRTSGISPWWAVPAMWLAGAELRATSRTSAKGRIGELRRRI